MKKSIFTLVIVCYTLFASAQTLNYGVRPIQQTISKNEANSATSLIDINPRFPHEWVSKYISVNLTITCGDEVLTAMGKGNALSQAQRRILALADTGSEIEATIRYYPDNSLRKEEKEMDFAFTVCPDIKATYNGGQEQIKKLIKESTVSLLDESDIQDIQHIALNFRVDTEGKAVDVRLSEPSNEDRVTTLLMGAINSMPSWSPAINLDGSIVSQEFELIVTRDHCSFSF